MRLLVSRKYFHLGSYVGVQLPHATPLGAVFAPVSEHPKPNVAVMDRPNWLSTTPSQTITIVTVPFLLVDRLPYGGWKYDHSFRTWMSIA